MALRLFEKWLNKLNNNRNVGNGSNTNNVSVVECMDINEFKIALFRTLFTRVSLDVTSHILITKNMFKPLTMSSSLALSGGESNILVNALTINQICTTRMFFSLRLRGLTMGSQRYFFDVSSKNFNESELESIGVLDQYDLILKPLFNVNDIDDAVITFYNAYKSIVKSSEFNNRQVFRLSGLRELLTKMETNSDRQSFMSNIANQLLNANDSEILIMDKDDSISVNNFDFESINHSLNYAMQKICMATGISKNILTGESPNTLNGAGILAQERLSYETVVQSLLRQLKIDFLDFYLKDGYKIGTSFGRFESLLDSANKCTDPIAKSKLYDIIKEQIDAMIV